MVSTVHLFCFIFLQLLAITVKEEALLKHVKEKMKKGVVADQLEKSFAKE